ncbi:hypothetical protein DFJ73DRAFT_967253 [Zopfochytrium polystomum]|nr:hypothetical protein DFJ73DRAFT_967253 [Zopfochytrium polystomum]
MKVTWSFIKRLHLDTTYGLLSARSAFLCWEVFKLLDWRGNGSLDDIQFTAFMTSVTDLKERQVYKVFDIFDLDRSGSVEFDEFYVLISILVAIKDDQGKQFMYQHWRTCFEILDEDGGKTVSLTEFSTLGFLFNFSKRAIKNIYREFDIAGNADTMDRTHAPPGKLLLAYARGFLDRLRLPFVRGGAAAAGGPGDVFELGSGMLGFPDPPAAQTAQQQPGAAGAGAAVAAAPEKRGPAKSGGAGAGGMAGWCGGGGVPVVRVERSAPMMDDEEADGDAAAAVVLVHVE